MLMAAKVDSGDEKISEKKRSRIKALEQRLSTAALRKSPAALSAHLVSHVQEEEKHKKKRDTGKRKHSDPAGAIGTFAQASLTSSGPSKFKAFNANDHAYLKLCQPVNENLLDIHLQTSEEKGGGDTISDILYDILRSGGLADRDTKDELQKLQDKYLALENPTSQRSGYKRAQHQTLHKLGKRSQKHMSMRQHRHFGSLDLPKKNQKYDLYLPMHEMWKEYIVDLLKNGRQKNIEYFLLTADLHGAILAVVESKIKSFIGVQGIMIRETLNTFGIMTSENRFRVVPKKGSVFMFQVEFWRVILHGDKVSTRNLNQDVE
ncbi:hypothetical protein SUGI_0879450 [Cryptomeria japonica]|uniref:ribonuclease MRP protein subunit POP4 n=1 Tax=Cryptomeria japonica TaxID=3369 RepID=UPI002414BF13|nr:ribonuclease MRP protein subunit POP4 [Cryptomeria japonica]XP_057854967.2 ribonuclease MRP protein subunit POP4 [Cryptomeria japonica]XP_057854968.2 ribonuclease MRP protein subunit POP4 [Cryptomeria japonica]XP_057854969.2 ribonuclease MRP protein subunit POP4 [Cryptomeria japonica]XP_057854970.2 ribonuclease MRP protein subunit POP4 [Cryptomeria japonica]XP_057854971.2 ribonuclease MRP protein subunit POP4 [Cryptomeria japonica]GLJ42438.1 hypothetical protein SUGI_0879450 [Cryptomeria j